MEGEKLSKAGSVRVWDGPVRLFHWALVGLIAFSWWTGEHHDMDRHRLSGYAILGLLIFRIYWGFVGSETARFAHFVRGPGAVVRYLRGLGQRPYRGTHGHNPAGGWSVMFMLATLLAMVGAGLFSVDVDGLESGPLADYVSFDTGRAAASVHHFVFNLLLTLVALHVVAVVIYLVGLRKDLISPMIHGRHRPDEPDAPETARAPLWKAIVGIGIAGAGTYAVAIGFHF